MSLIFAIQLTAVARTVLAVFATVTAVVAVLAFRRRSQEVSDHAPMLSVQSERLEGQRAINALQAGDQGSGPAWTAGQAAR